MSTRAVLDFWTRAAGDEGLRQKLQSLPAANKGDAVVKLGSQQGYAFTWKEFEEMGTAGAFLWRVQQDAGLRQKVAAAGRLGTRAAQRAEVMRIAGDAGFRFQPEHLSQVTEFAKTAGDAELSERDLDRVSGGILPGCIAVGAGVVVAVTAAVVVAKVISDATSDKGFKANPETGEGCTRPTWGGSGGGLPGFP